MDKIIIKDLEIYAFHGVNIEEKNLGQKFLISVELVMDLRVAGKNDELMATVNYAQLCIALEKEFTKEKYDLIEHAAEELCIFILLNYERVQQVKLLLKKPWAPIGRMVDYAAVELERGWHTAYIALGSNLGDKEANVRQAVERIQDSNMNKVIQTSKWYETEPVGYVDQDTFINGALEIKTLLTPKELMQCLIEIEKELKRERTIPWGPRTIDLDVLL